MNLPKSSACSEFGSVGLQGAFTYFLQGEYAVNVSEVCQCTQNKSGPKFQKC